MNYLDLKKYDGCYLSNFLRLTEDPFHGCGQNFYKGFDDEIIMVESGDAFDDFCIVVLDADGDIDEMVVIGEIASGQICLFGDDTLQKICVEGLRFY